MELNRDSFEYWLFLMDEEIAEFMNSLPDNISMKMDYSADSLIQLESWLLSKYKTVKEILNASEKQNLDRFSRYVGETMRKNLGGIWNIELKNKKNVYYKIPVIEKKGYWVECPVTLVTASIDRRTGEYIAGVLRAIANG
jgi:hypothetical protein